MIANFFNKSKLINFIILLLGILVFYGSYHFVYKSTPLLDFFTLKQIGFFVILLFTLLLINFITYKNQLTNDHYYALLLLVLMFGIFPKTLESNVNFYAHLFVLFALRKVFNLRSYKNTTLKLFDGGFWIGVATLFLNISVLYLILLYVALIIYKRVKVNTLLIPLVGFITPIFLYFAYCFYLDAIPRFLNIVTFDFNFDYAYYSDTKVLVPLIFLIVVAMLSTLSVTFKILSVSKEFNLQWVLMINSLLIATIIVVILPTKDTSEFIFLMFPTALIIANYLERLTSDINKNFILYAFLLLTGSVYFL